MVFIIDWDGTSPGIADDVALDGTTTLTDPYGNMVDINVLTPLTVNPNPAPDTEWTLGTGIGDPDGELSVANSSSPTVATITVATGMTGTTFELYDIDQSSTAGNPWDDLVKVYALDEFGVPMATLIEISNTNLGTHTVATDGTTTTIGATGNVSGFVEGSGAADTVTVTIPGLIYGFVVEYSAGPTNYYSGIVGIGPVTFGDPTLGCFTRGTMIETETGDVAIEDLVAGDMIRTMDNGFKPLSWIGSSTVKGIGSRAPILFRKGAIGNTEDLLLSPAHRVMLQDWQVDLLFGTSEILASAQSLVNDSTIIRQVTDEVEYFHIMFESHEIVFSNGAPTESFHPGEFDVSAMAQEARDEIFSIFPELEHNKETYGPSARNTLRPHEAVLLNL